MEPNNDAAKEAARYAVATNAPAARSGPPQIISDELSNRFAYHAPLSQTRRQAHENVRGQVGRLAHFIAATVPAGREQALAITKLEEAMMWANAGLARASDPDAGNAEQFTARQKGQRAYEVYAVAANGVTHDGRAMPAWDDLGDQIQRNWIAVGTQN